MARELPSTYPTLCYMEARVPPKIRVLPPGTLSQTPDFRKLSRQVDRVVNKTRRRSSLLTTPTTVDAAWLFIAKFHYTDPTRTGPDTDKVRAHCRRRAKFHYTDTDTDTDPTRTRPDSHGLFLRRNSVGSVRVADKVRAGPCSGI